MLLKVKIGDEKVIELSRDIKHFMQCLNLILDYLMTVSIKKQILILILAAFSRMEHVGCWILKLMLLLRD